MSNSSQFLCLCTCPPTGRMGNFRTGRIRNAVQGDTRCTCRVAIKPRDHRNAETKTKTSSGLMQEPITSASAQLDTFKSHLIPHSSSRITSHRFGAYGVCGVRLTGAQCLCVCVTFRAAKNSREPFKYNQHAGKHNTKKHSDNYLRRIVLYRVCCKIYLKTL